MSIVVKKSLVCDFPECYAVKVDLVWWEPDPGDERSWNHTSDNRDWCPRHTREEIDALYVDGSITVPCGCMACDPPNGRWMRMYVCPRCGSKRCHGAMNHEYGCEKND